MKMDLFYTTEVLGGHFPGKLSEEQVVSQEKGRGALLKALKPPSRREENGRDVCKARGNEACREQ